MSRRPEMLGSTIQRELAQFIMREMNDPRLPTVVSITRVKVSPDLEYADVFVSVMGTPGQQTAALNALKHAAGMMRSRLTKSLTLRHAPFLRFQIDEQLKKELQVLDLIEQARRENEELDRKRAAETAGEPAPDADGPAPEALAAEASVAEASVAEVPNADPELPSPGGGPAGGGA